MNLDFVMPTHVYMRRRCVAVHGKVLASLGKKAFILSDRSDTGRSTALADVIALLNQLEIAFEHFDEVTEMPALSLCYRTADLAKATSCEFVIAIGGEAVMDVGKVVSHLVCQDIPMRDFFHTQYVNQSIPLAVVSTVAGSGAEVAPYVDLVDERRKRKRTRHSEVFSPLFAFLDPSYSESLASSQLVATSLETLAQAIEGIYSLQATPISHVLAISVIKSVIPQLKRICRGDSVNREQLLFTSMQSGIVLAITSTGLLHEMGHPLSYHKAMNQGLVSGLLLPGYLRMMQPHTASLTNDILIAGGWDEPDDVAHLIDCLIPTRTSPTEEEFVTYANHAMKLEYVTRYRVVPSMGEVVDIYRECF